MMSSLKKISSDVVWVYSSHSDTSESKWELQNFRVENFQVENVTSEGVHVQIFTSETHILDISART